MKTDRYEWSQTAPTIPYLRVMPGPNRAARRRRAAKAQAAARTRLFVLENGGVYDGEFYVTQRAIVALQRRNQLRTPADALRVIERDPILNSARKRYTKLHAQAA